jgi:primosomal protein N' (replication factor Y)
LALVRVAVPVPGLGLLTYRIPDGLDVAVGARVVVPVGARKVTGVVTEAGITSNEIAGARLRDVQDVLDEDAFLPADVVRLALWIAEYYLAGAGEAIATALPPHGWLRSDTSIAWVASPTTPVPDGDRVAALIHAQGPVLRSQLERLLRVHAGPADDAVRGADVARALRRLETQGLVSASPVVTGKADASRRRRWVRPTAAADAAATGRLGKRQAEACALLRATPGGIDSADLRQRGIGSDVVRRLVSMGLAQVEWRAIERDPFASGVLGDTPTGVEAGDPSALYLDVTDEQREVLDTLLPILERREFRAALLHGVTGSGKTQVYLRLARACLDAGRTVLLLVPEIALTPAVARLFRHAFGSRVAIQHSGLSDGERYDQWHRIRRGEVDVVVGTRSAVFAPLPRIGLVIVDEEHDTAYKQEDSPRYSGRDAAIVRARDAGALVVLGSATPSLETFRNASEERYLSLRMRRRVLDRPLASVRIVDMREEYAAAGPDVVLSAPLVASLEQCLARGEQAMVLLNRRGYAPSLFCRACGETVECPNCSVTLTVHRAAREVRCHYCNHARPLPRRCASCGGEYLEFTGIGTERVEQEVAARFPDARLARVDRDTMTRRGAIARVLERFARREIDVLVGTQMIAKGHDFPQVTLVGVISADIGLGVADFRAAERTFQLLTQVAGRAGRGDVGGEALVQTLHPHHYAIVLAARQDYDAFTAHELEFRERMRYPPYVSLINIVIRHATVATAMRDAEGMATALREVGGFAVLGPAPAPLGRLRGEARVQVFLKGRDRTAMRHAVRATLQARPEVARRATVDVDPLSML